MKVYCPKCKKLTDSYNLGSYVVNDQRKILIKCKAWSRPYGYCRAVKKIVIFYN